MTGISASRTCAVFSCRMMSPFSDGFYWQTYSSLDFVPVHWLYSWCCYVYPEMKMSPCWCHVWFQTYSILHSDHKQFLFRAWPHFGAYLLWVTSCSVKYNYEKISGGPLSALTCCVNVRLLSAIKKISPLIYSQSWVGSWVYTTQAMMTFTLIF